MMLRVQPQWAVVAVVILAFDTAVAETPIATCSSVVWDNYPIGHKPAFDSSHADPGDANRANSRGSKDGPKLSVTTIRRHDA